jgi:CheY-like chemotaxis protein
MEMPGNSVTSDPYDQAGQSDSRSAAHAATEPDTASCAPATVLVVDDNPHVAQVTVEMLELLGYRTVRADNALEALQALAGHHEIALVFSDIVMPGMDGIALAQEIGRRHPAMPVLLTTAYSHALQVAPTALTVLRKPFEIPTLERAVRRAIQGRAGR